MKKANIKIHGEDEAYNLTFDLDMDLNVSNAQKVMVYVLELKVMEQANEEASDVLDSESDSMNTSLLESKS